MVLIFFMNTTAKSHVKRLSDSNCARSQKFCIVYLQLKDHHQDETNKDDAKIEQEVHSIQKRISFSIKPLHSNTNWWKWLLTLSVERVIETQNVCRHMMKVMGYTEIQTIKDIEPASLIKSFCPNQNITFC